MSVDRSQESYNEYYKSMPWLALPLADERVQQLTRHFSVQGDVFVICCFLCVLADCAWNGFVPCLMWFRDGP